ncbi:MAG: hypothetical protein QM755_24505 [Luteolibacter sp.]
MVSPALIEQIGTGCRAEAGVRLQRLKPMKKFVLLVLVFLAFVPAVFAGGGSEIITAELMNGWRLQISSADGSKAYIERKVDGVYSGGRIQFDQFPAYYLILSKLPHSPKNKPTQIKIVEGEKEETTYLVDKDALPIFHLLLLTHLQKITSLDPEKLAKELNAHSPLPPNVMREPRFTVKPIE